MADITILDNEFVTLQYLEDQNAIYHVVHQPLSGDPLREMLTMGLNAVQQYGVCKWVSDDRKNGPMSEEDRAWGEANITPRAAAMGWKYWALVVPEQVVAAGSMGPTMEGAFDHGLRMMVFSDTDEAFEWIAGFEC